MKFGTSGLRGLVCEMTDALCARYARAFAAHLAASGARPRAVLIGRDLRPSSPRIARACAEALAGIGVDVAECGALPTPALALAAGARGLPAIMVTGSHIPFDRNGLKFYRAQGEITKADEAGMLACLDAPAPAGAGRGRIREDAEAARLYPRRSLDFFAPRLLAGKRIGVYQHSAVGRDLIGEVLAGLGAEVVALGRTEAFVPIDTEAVRPEDEALARGWARAHGLDALVSTDGDGDRPLLGDETGALLRGDVVGVLAARHLGAEAVATPVSSNTVLERSRWFSRIARTRIGSPHVIAAMEALIAQGGPAGGLVVGYEANGGFLLGGPVTGASGARLAPLMTRDAMLPMLAVLALAARTGRPLSALSADLPARFTASDRLAEFDSARSGPLLEALAGDAAARARLLGGIGAVEDVDLTDGVRMTLEGGEIVHLRASGNAPELRCYAEAGGEARARALVAALLAEVARSA